MRVMTLCFRTPGENRHTYKYLHLKPVENCPRIPIGGSEAKSSRERIRGVCKQPVCLTSQNSIREKSF